MKLLIKQIKRKRKDIFYILMLVLASKFMFLSSLAKWQNLHISYGNKVGLCLFLSSVSKSDLKLNDQAYSLWQDWCCWREQAYCVSTFRQCLVSGAIKLLVCFFSDTIRYLSLHDNKYIRYFPGHTKR